MWKPEDLAPDAKAVSASRRCDIPAFFSEWFNNRLDAGWAEYIPAGPPRRIRRSLRCEDVTHFCFWSKWPRPFLRVHRRVLDSGYPVLWNITITGLGGTDVEPRVPPSHEVVQCVRDLTKDLPSAAIQWRYDPIFLSERFDSRHHIGAFSRLAEELAGSVDRIAVSFVNPGYSRRVKPDLKLYQIQTGDRYNDPAIDEKVDLLAQLDEIAASFSLPLTTCCSPEVESKLGLQRSGCNSFKWALRVYPALSRGPQLKRQRTRSGCDCSAESDIGCYDTCIFGCRYSYGSCSHERALANHRRHDPKAPCLIP